MENKKKLSVYVVKMSKVGFDEYRDFGVVARNHKRAVHIVTEFLRKIKARCVCIEAVEKVDLRKEKIMMYNYNSG